uniref:Nucleoprotein n=1 Tax=Ganwon-do negev-like virus 1 TaxID=2789888 RepID=A0A7S8WJS6_9VIRU|nr:nucleoprotein [Ganwon-do negev-like virus 1]
MTSAEIEGVWDELVKKDPYLTFFSSPKWVGSAAPYFAAIKSFFETFSEMKFGMTKKTINKALQTTRPVSEYGIPPEYRAFLHGLNFQPAVKTSMAQSVGPLTALIEFATSAEPYYVKWADALKRMYANVPCITGFIDELADMPDTGSLNFSNAAKLLVDLTPLVLTREQRRGCLPFCFFRDYFADLTIETDIATTKEKVIGVKAKDDFDERVASFSWSGYGFFMAWKNVSAKKYKVTTNVSVDDLKVMFSMLMLKAHLDDLSIFKAITELEPINSTSFRKKNMHNSFVTLDDKEKFHPQKDVIIPVPKIISKFASATLRKDLATPNKQVVGNPQLTGMHRHILTETFKKFFVHGDSRMVNGNAIDTVRLFLKKLKEELFKNGQDLKVIREIGTLEWVESESLKYVATKDAGKIKIEWKYKEDTTIKKTYDPVGMFFWPYTDTE